MMVSPSRTIGENNRTIGDPPPLGVFANHRLVLFISLLVGSFINWVAAGVILAILLCLRADLRRQWRWRLLTLVAFVFPPVFVIAAPTVLVREAIAPKLAYWKRYREWPYEYDRTPEQLLWLMLGAAVIVPPGPVALVLSIAGGRGVPTDMVPSLIHPGLLLGLTVYATTALCVALRPDLRSLWHWRIALGAVFVEYAVLTAIVVST